MKSIKKKKKSRLQVEKIRTAANESLGDIPDAIWALKDLNGLDLKTTMQRLGELEQSTAQMEKLLLECRSLAERAARDDVDDEERLRLQARADQLVAQYNHLARSTDFSLKRRIEAALNRDLN